jgi:hypothetical protein
MQRSPIYELFFDRLRGDLSGVTRCALTNAAKSGCIWVLVVGGILLLNRLVSSEPVPAGRALIAILGSCALGAFMGFMIEAGPRSIYLSSNFLTIYQTQFRRPRTFATSGIRIDYAHVRPNLVRAALYERQRESPSVVFWLRPAEADLLGHALAAASTDVARGSSSSAPTRRNPQRRG